MKNKDLLKRNKIYQATYLQMKSYESAYLGGYAFKQAVRRKRPSEDSTLYIDLLQNTVAQPVCRYIVDTINDVLFEPGVKRNLTFCTAEGTYIEPNNTEWARLFTLDADLNNRSIDAFMEQIGDLTSIFGHCWVAVDMPKTEDGNLGRPYVVAISPLSVYDWEFDYYGGRPMLKYVKVLEHESDDCYYFKCYYLGTATEPTHWRQYEVEKNLAGDRLNYDAELLAEGDYPPGMSIPVFIAYGRKDPRIIDLGISDIDAATDAQREHYKLECEAYSSIQFAKTIIRADKGVTVPAHAGAIVRATQGQVETISVDTGDVEKIMKKQADILEQIEALTGLGGLRNTKNQIASGVAIIEERKQLHRLAKAKARLMEVTEEMIFTYAARFMDMRWAGEVHYNTDYEAHDTNYRLALMGQARALVQNNEIVDSLITRQVIGMLAPAETIPEYEQAYINSIPNEQVRELMTDENTAVYSRDMGSMVPSDNGETNENTNSNGDYNDNGGNADNSSVLGGPGTPITPMGASYYTQQVPAVLLSGINTGR
jgi:hypothetical protein